MFLKSPTDHALLLVAVRSSKESLYRLASPEGEFGFSIHLHPSKLVVDQFVDKIQDFFQLKNLAAKIKFIPEFRCEVKLTSGEEGSLFLAVIDDLPTALETAYPTFPDVMRKLPKNRNRLGYLKAWQVLAGGLNDDNRVVEV